MRWAAARYAKKRRQYGDWRSQVVTAMLPRNLYDRRPICFATLDSHYSQEIDDKHGKFVLT
jgi:hypothetical protein